MDRESQKILSLVVRDSATSSLVADFPRSSLKTVILLPQFIIKLKTTSDTKVAMKFSDFQSYRKFADILEADEVQLIDKSISIPIPMLPRDRLASMYEGNLPDLEDPLVQEMILRLLFREDFKNFVADLSILLDAMQDNIEDFP
jgi:hypothetical protein